MPTTVYGDISPRTAAYASKELLERANPLLVLERFGQAKPLPEKSSKTIKFRRYNSLDPTPNPLTEGVTPSGKKMTATDVSASVVQYGDFIEISDVVQDTHEDPVLKEGMAVCGEQAANMLELVRFGILKAGTNVYRAGGAASRDAISKGLTIGLQRESVRGLKRQNARTITKIVGAGAGFSTEPIAAAYIAVTHVDLETTIRKLPGFVPVEKYSDHMKAMPGEVGKVEEVRYVTSTVFAPWEDAGGAVSSANFISTAGTKADVYPILFFGADAYGLVSLKGKNSVTPTVLNPNSPRGGDPLGQRGTIGWKTYASCVILNDAWMARAEVAVSTDLES